jgi:hypothetical protein
MLLFYMASHQFFSRQHDTDLSWSILTYGAHEHEW